MANRRRSVAKVFETFATDANGRIARVPNDVDKQIRLKALFPPVAHRTRLGVATSSLNRFIEPREEHRMWENGQVSGRAYGERRFAFDTLPIGGISGIRQKVTWKVWPLGMCLTY